jgi:hypothetical protein
MLHGDPPDSKEREKMERRARQAASANHPRMVATDRIEGTH